MKKERTGARADREPKRATSVRLISDAVQIAKEHARVSAVVVTRHARDRMEERQVSDRDLIRLLLSDQSRWEEQERDGRSLFKFRVVGTDGEGEELKVVVAVDPPNKVVAVTVF